MASSSIQYGLTTTLSASGGQSSGAYEFRQSGGTGTVSITGSGNSRTLTGTALGTANMEVRKLGDSAYFDSAWVSAGTLTITQRLLTGSFTVASPKVYDDTTLATVLTRSLSNLATGDTQDANGVYLTGGEANFDTKAVGTGKTVTLTGMSLAGAKAANYSLDTMNTTTADIIPGPPSMAPNPPQLQEQGDPLPVVRVISDRVAGAALEPIKVRFYDAYGNPVAAGHSVSVTVNKNAFTSGSTLTATTDTDGYATFDNLTLEAADTDYELTFAVDEPGAL